MIISKRITFNKALALMNEEGEVSVQLPDSPVARVASTPEMLKHAFEDIGWPVEYDGELDAPKEELVGTSVPVEEEGFTPPPPFEPVIPAV